MHDHVIVLGERHAPRLLDEYARYYNTERAHPALFGDAPEHRERELRADGRIVAVPQLAGLHHSYRRAAESVLDRSPIEDAARAVGSRCAQGSTSS